MQNFLYRWRSLIEHACTDQHYHYITTRQRKLAEAEVNGQPALIIRAAGRAFSVLTIEVEAGHIQTIRIVANPEKLAHV